MTLAIALWGAVLATAGIAFQFIAFTRDRPELTVSGAAQITRPAGAGPYVLRVDVANCGKRATTIVEIGFEASGGEWFAHMDAAGNVNIKRSDVVAITPGDRRTIPQLRLSDEGSVRLLQPGEVATYQWIPTAAIFPVDTPLRPYATDSHGRQTWGQARPFLRTFRDAGWLPPPTHPTTSTLLHAAPIAPVWQAWKPRAQRGSWRRFNDYRAQRWRRTATRTTLTPAGLPSTEAPEARD
jgi:hypothetical protein